MEGQLSEEALPLDHRLPGHVLLDDAVGPGVLVVVEGVRVAEEGVGIEALDSGGIEAGGEAELLADDGAILVAHGDAALVAGLGDDLDGERVAAGDVAAEDRGVDGGAEVIEVGDPDVAAALGAEALEEAAAAERVRHVAVTRGIEIDGALGVAEEGAVRAEPQGRVLLEDREAGVVEAGAEGLPDGAVGGLAGHEPEGKGAPVAAREGVFFCEPQVEEGLPGERLDEGLHHAPHARRHPAGQDQQGDLTPPQGLLPEGLVLLLLRAAVGGQREHIPGGRRAHRGEAVGGVPIEALALLLGPAKEPFQVEGALRQSPLDLRGERLDLLL